MKHTTPLHRGLRLKDILVPFSVVTVLSLLGAGTLAGCGRDSQDSPRASVPADGDSAVESTSNLAAGSSGGPASQAARSVPPQIGINESNPQNQPEVGGMLVISVANAPGDKFQQVNLSISGSAETESVTQVLFSGRNESKLTMPLPYPISDGKYEVRLVAAGIVLARAPVTIAPAPPLPPGMRITLDEKASTLVVQGQLFFDYVGIDEEQIVELASSSDPHITWTSRVHPGAGRSLMTVPLVPPGNYVLRLFVMTPSGRLPGRLLATSETFTLAPGT